MKNITKKLSDSKSLPITMLVFTIASCIVMYSCRFVWVFVDTAVKFNLTTIVFAIMIVNTFVLGSISFLRLNKQDVTNKKSYKVTLGISLPFAILSTIIAIVFVIVTSSRESGGVLLEYLKASSGLALGFILVPSVAIFLPSFSPKIKNCITCFIIIFTLIFAFLNVFPIEKYKITSAPAVIDTGSGYSVVFATTSQGTGYITYNYNGTDYKVYDNTGGRLNSDSKIHSVFVPYEHLKNNTYKVGSVKVIDGFSYGSRLGKEVVSDSYTFKTNENETQKYLTVSDWHTNIDGVYSCIPHLDDYNGVILLGDASPGLDFENEAAKNIVELAGTVSKGEMPIIYTRGNHETRGNYAGKLLDALGLPEFYYQTKIGDISFIILDSGEDKDDSHPEYGGLTDYNTYRKNQIEWLKNVTVDTEKAVVLCHSWKISDVEEDLSSFGWQEIDRLGTSLLVCGHSHNCRFVGTETEDESEIKMMNKYPHIKAYMDGGNTGDVFVASHITFDENNILITAVNSAGEKVFEESVKW